MNIMKIESEVIVPSDNYLSLLKDFLQRFPYASLGGSFVLRGCGLLPRDIGDVDFVVPTKYIQEVQNYIMSFANNRIQELNTNVDLLDDGFGGKHIHTFIDAYKITGDIFPKINTKSFFQSCFTKSPNDISILKIGVFFQDGVSGFQVYDVTLNRTMTFQNLDVIIQAKEHYVKEKPESYSSEKHIYDLDFIKQHYETFKMDYALKYIL